MTGHRRLRVAVCAIVGAILATGSLTACGEPDPTITITSLDFRSRTGHAFASTKAGSTYVLPAGLPGDVSITFTSGVEYPSCTLDFDGRAQLSPRSSPLDRSTQVITKPTAALLASAKITGSLTCVKDTAGSVPRSSSFMVSAVPAPMVTMTPTKLSFGSVKVGAKSAPATVTVTSDGSAPAAIVSIDYPRDSFGVDADACTGKKLNVGASCSFRILFAPKSDQALPPSKLTIRLGGGAVFGPDAIPMDGSVDRGEGGFTPSSDPLDFGWVVAGTSQPKTLTVTNTGTGSLYIKYLTLLSRDYVYNSTMIDVPVNTTVGYYWIAEDGCSGRTLAPTETCQARLTFTPTTETPLSLEAYLVFMADPTPEWNIASILVPSTELSPYKVKLIGTGMAAAQPQQPSDGQPHG